VRSTFNLIRMKKQTTPWVFPTVKVLVNIAYYFVSFICLLVLGFGIFKVASSRFVNESPDHSLTSVGLPVEWKTDERKAATKAPVLERVSLIQEKEKGILHVPIWSAAGGVYLVAQALGLVSAIVLLYLLRKIFTTLNITSPFSASNVRRISAMGFILIAQDLLAFGAELALRSLVKPYVTQLSATNLAKDLTFNTFEIHLGIEGAWFLGLILLALAQVYRRGIELQVENDLTI
jgi:hypothetical protein